MHFDSCFRCTCVLCCAPNTKATQHPLFRPFPWSTWQDRNPLALRQQHLPVDREDSSRHSRIYIYINKQMVLIIEVVAMPAMYISIEVQSPWHLPVRITYSMAWLKWYGCLCPLQKWNTITQSERNGTQAKIYMTSRQSIDRGFLILNAILLASRCKCGPIKSIKLNWIRVAIFAFCSC